MSRPRRGLRVIAGTAKGRRIDAPPGTGTRPITDRTKESLFGTLGPSVADARVLDLYGGSGALSIEALSRGAEAAVIVERDRRAAAVLAGNVERTGFDAAVEVHVADVAAFLERRASGAFDLVFVDPPYAMDTPAVEGQLALLDARGWVDSGSIVVMRRRTTDGAPALPSRWRFTRERTFGDTLLLVAVVD